MTICFRVCFLFILFFPSLYFYFLNKFPEFVLIDMEFIANWFTLCCKLSVIHTSMKLPNLRWNLEPLG